MAAFLRGRNKALVEVDERIDDALEINKAYEMCDRSGDNRQMFKEAEERKYVHATIRDCVSLQKRPRAASK